MELPAAQPGARRFSRPSEGLAVQAYAMRIATLALAAALVPVIAQAQYNQGPQPYNAQDPNNYSAPAQQSYYQGQPQQQQYQGQQAPYPQQDQQYGGQYQGGQEQIYQAPPALPEYDQPPAPGDGYIWTPGYWAFGPQGYYWVPGAWVEAPYDGALWTPGYWGYGGSGYFWNAGYWGPVVGFYGGINYGFGYFGTGFWGGYWRDHHFWYNREYAHFGGGIHNFYSQRVEGINNIHPSGRSFTNASAPRGGEFRGGSYNNAARGFAGNNAGVSHGYTPGQAAPGHPAYPGSTYSNMNRGNYGAPTYSAPAQRSYQPAATARPQTFNGGAVYGRPAAPSGGQQHYSEPAAPHYSAPAAPHYSAPSGGGGHFSAPSGGGGHASGGGGGHAGGGHR